MEPTEFGLPKLPHSISVLSATLSDGSIAAAKRGAGLAGFSGISNITTLATAESWRDGAHTTHYEQTGYHAIAIPRPTHQWLPPLFVPTRSPLQDGPAILSPLATISEWHSRIDTQLSVASPSLFTNLHTSNSPSVEESYGTALILRPNRTQPRQTTPPQSPPSSAPSNNTIYTRCRSLTDRLYGIRFIQKITPVSSPPTQATTITLAGQYGTARSSITTLAGQYSTPHDSTTTLPDQYTTPHDPTITLPDQYSILHASTTTLAGQYWTPHDSTVTLGCTSCRNSVC